jgi:hypothetical protein
MSAGELVMRCFHARTTAHVLHLKTRSYAQHKALNEFYDEIVPLADTYAETYQGSHGLIESFPPKYTPCSEPLEMLKELADWIAANRAACCGPKETHLQNIIDEIVALINQTRYKLAFLK